MDKIKFKELLMNISICAIACDGDIDEREIEALKNIEKNTPYFSGIDLSKKLESSLKNCLADLDKFQKDIFNKLESAKLNIIQELMILEISMRIISADQIELEIEKEYINNLRKYLQIDDFLINERFGDIEYLRPMSNEFNSEVNLPNAVEKKKFTD
tara:strand:- start:985 stop:1455 length:471 start_codon:yes stop_codon:yes gene_type:complete